METSAAAPEDIGRLLDWFAGHDVALDSSARLTLITGGRSNLTYRVEDDHGHSYVLRRPPRGQLIQTAHDVAREHRIVSALGPTDVPTPRTYGLCSDPAVLGAPFYVMNLVPGLVLATPDDGLRLAPGCRAAASGDLADVLGRIHRLDVDQVGLGDLGRREQYLERQLRRWLRQFQEATRRDLPLVAEVHAQLVRTAPPQRYTGLVHGDYRPGNVLLGENGAVNAVLDWELTALGDTMADLGWMIAYWSEPGETQLLASPTPQPGWWTRREVIDRYQQLTGRDVSDLGWYQAFALWRLACIGEGIYTRYQTGAMGDDGLDVVAQGELVINLTEASRRALQTLR